MSYTYNDFLADYAIGYEKHLSSAVPSSTQRAGQFFFNLLYEKRPEIANWIRGSFHDPFHHDEVHPETHRVCEGLWDNPSGIKGGLG